MFLQTCHFKNSADSLTFEFHLNVIVKINL